MGKVRKYRFFYHYNKWNGGMTVHYRGACNPCIDVKCLVPSETKWNRFQPKLVMQGFAEKIEINPETKTITIS